MPSLVRGQCRIRHFAGLLHQLDVETQRLQLANQYVERFRHARFDGGLALDDGLVDFRAAIHIVRLRRQQFLQDVRGAIGFERPDLHFAETLPAELRLAAQRLLRNQGIRPDGARVNLVVHQVGELQHVDVAHRHRLFELNTRHAVIERRLARSGQTGIGQRFLDFALRGAVEHRGRILHAQRLRGPPQVGFQNLTDVHAAGNAQRIEDDFHRCSIREVRHVLIGQNARDHTLVSVAARHLVAHAQLALHGDVDLHQLDHAGRQLIALAQLGDLLIGDLFQHRYLARRHLFDFVDLFVQPRILAGEAHALQIARLHLLDELARQLRVLAQQALVGLFIVQVGQEFLAFQQHAQAFGALIRQDADFILQIALQTLDLRFLDHLRPLVLLLAFAGEDLAIDDGALDARRTVERCVLHIASLFAENRAQQLLFRRELGFALGRHLAHQNVARLHGGADADDPALVQVAQKTVRDIRNVAGDFLRPELGVAGFDFEFFNVDRSVVVFLDELLADQDGVFEVVPAPGHEGHQHVASQGQFAQVGTRTIGQHRALGDALAHPHNRLLIDTGVLVAPLEFGELVDVRAHLARKLAFMRRAFHAYDDAFAIHRIDDAGALVEHHGAGIARRDHLHAGAHIRSVGAQERHGLALHVGTHQRAVGVVVFQERNQAGGHADELLGADVDVLDFVPALEHEVAGLPGVGQIGHDAALLVQFHVRLGDGPLVLFPRREVLAVGFEFHRLLLDTELAVGVVHFRAPQYVAHFVVRIARVQYLDFVHHRALDHLAVGALDEPVLVDARKARQRRNQTDVRTFRRFDGADAAVVRGMHVADFESSAFPAQAAGSQRRKTALVRDLAQRIGLIHELRKLAGSEEFANRRHHRLGVHQVVRHGRRHLLVDAHLFLYGGLHAHQADAELVFQQFAHCAHAAVAQVIDVVHRANALAQLQQVLDGALEVFRIERALVERRGVRAVVELDVELHAAHARKIVLARVEEHALEQLRGRVHRGRIAGTQFAVNFDQRVALVLHGVLADSGGNHTADVVALREENFELVDAGFDQLAQHRRRQLAVGVDHDFAGGHVHHVGDHVRAFHIVGRDFHLLDLGFEKFLVQRGGDLLALSHHRIAALGGDGVRKLQAGEILIHVPEQLLVADFHFADAVEGAQNLLVRLQTQGAEEYRAVEFALAVDTYVKDILVVVLELYPAAAIRDDLAEIIALRLHFLEKHARRTVQLADNHALGAVDDERAVVGHQRNFAEEHFLLFDVPHAFFLRFGILGIHGQADGDLEGRRIGHAALLALLHVVLELQPHRVAALVAERHHVFVESSAMMAQDVAGVERVGADGGAATAAGRPQVVQPLEVTALAFPVADGIIDELQIAHAAKIRDREHAIEHGLQADVLALIRQQVHLQEALV